MLGETSEPTTLNQTCHAHGRASPALHVRTTLGSNGFVRLHPDRSSADGHGRLRMSTVTPLRNKRRVHCDVIHVPRPNQQRIRRVRSSLIAVAAAFHDQAQIVFASKVYGHCNIIRVSCRNRINAWLCNPRVHPTQSLRKTRLIANVVGIIEILENVLTGRAFRCGLAGGQGELDWK